MEALKREVYEETGLDAVSWSLFGTFSDPSRILAYSDGNIHRVITIAYKVAVGDFDGLRASAESEAIAFFPMDELDSIDMPSTQRHIVEHLRSPDELPVLD